MPLSKLVAQWQFPTPCPSCRRDGGEPIENHTPNAAGQIEITIRCSECGYQWRESADSPAMFMPDFRKKPDRRRSS